MEEQEEHTQAPVTEPNRAEEQVKWQNFTQVEVAGEKKWRCNTCLEKDSSKPVYLAVVIRKGSSSIDRGNCMNHNKHCHSSQPSQSSASQKSGDSSTAHHKDELIKFIAATNSPFEIVENDGFKRLLARPRNVKPAWL
jgi:hypothetical protein